MEIYLLKSAACLAIFLAFYKLFMEKESFHHLKRFYLLTGLIGSFVIPLVTFTTYVEVAPVSSEITFIGGGETGPLEMEEPFNYTSSILWSLYILGVLFFATRFFRNLFRLLHKIWKNPRVKRENVFHVLLKTPTTPHTFFSYIFLNREKFQKKEIPQEVLAHEQAHAVQKHSLDILFIEIVQVVFWFNPLLYFFKHNIKLNHEFLADQVVLNQGNERTTYQKILLAFSSSATPPAMANSIHYSSFKKRFTVMKTHTSKRALWLKTLLLLPLVSLLLYGFSTTETVEKISSDSQVTFQDSVAQESDEVWRNNTIHKSSPVSATQTQLNVYNRLAKKYNAIAIEERKIGWEDLKTLENIYRLMNDAQKQNALPFPECLPKNQTSWEVDYAKEFNDGAIKNQKKSIVITVNVSEIMINGRATTLKNFAKELDRATKDWTTADYEAAHPSVLVASTPNSFMKKLDAEFRKTNYFKANNGVSIIPTSPPPPPPPATPNAPKVIKGVNTNDTNIPPPPPPPSADLGIEVMRKYKNNIVLYVNGEDIYLNGKKTTVGNFTNALNEHTKNWQKEDFKLYGLAIEKVNVTEAFIEKINTAYRKSKLAKQSQTKTKYLIGDNTLLSPPPPPPPVSPLDHIIEMAKKNATFYLEGKQIASDKAIEVIKGNKDLHIQTTGSSSKNPQVKISTKPITYKSNKTGAIEH